MYDSGAEPLEDHEIEQIQKVKISSEHMRNSLQCSVCLDNFKVNEEVKMLPCHHHFHGDCIDPWLELRGTCPDCRRRVVPDIGNDETEEDDNDEETLHSSMISSHASHVSYDRIPGINGRVVRVVESVNGNVYYEDIDDDDDVEEVTVLEGMLEQSSSTVDQLHLNDNDLRNGPNASWSDDATTLSPVTSPLWVSVDDSEFRVQTDPGSCDDTAGNTTIDYDTIDDDTIADTTIPSSPSIITVWGDASDDDEEIATGYYWTGRREVPFERCVLSEASSDSSSDRMCIDSESSEEVSIASTSDLSMYDEY